MVNRRLTGILLAVALILLIPLIAMQFTNEVVWTLFDFVVMGALLLGTGLACEFAMRKISEIQHQVAVCAGIVVVLVLVWVELAIGIFGTPFGGS